MQLVFYWAPKLARKCESKHWFPCGADGRSYGHVITKFSRIGRLPHFLSYGAPSTRAREARGWSSANNCLLIIVNFYRKQYPLPAVSRLARRGEQWLHVCYIFMLWFSFILGLYLFPFVLNSLSYITMPKNKGK